MAQAPTNQPGPKPVTPPPTPATAAKPTDTPTPTNGAGAETPPAKRKAAKRMVFVVTGEVKEFESINQAEKFLNSPEAPKDCTVLQGIRTRKSTKVSLR